MQTLTPQQRLALILHFAQTGVYFNVPELWQIDDPKITLRAVTHFPEPYTPIMLAALERVLPKFQTVQDSDRAAAILYRYRRKSGEDFLEGRLVHDDDPVSAGILAANQDQAMFATILNLYVQDPQQNVGLVPYLARWKSPLIGPALLKGFKSDQEDALYASALPEQFRDLSKRDRLEAVALVRKQYSLASPDDSAKIVAAAALIRMGADPQDRMYQFLVSALHSRRTSDFNKSEVVVQLRYVSPERALPLLEEIIENYMALTPSALQKRDSDPRHIIDADDFATLAAGSLAALHAVSSAGEVSALLRKLHDMDAAPVLQGRAGRALLRLGDPQAVITKVMGDLWLSQETAKRRLRPLPGYDDPD